MSAASLPETLTLMQAGTNIVRSPQGISSGPFWVEYLLTSTRDGDPTAMRATLDPGVRTHWHGHPRGQLLLALSGVGLAQRRGGEIIEIRAGDAIWFAPDEIHWHGAASQSVFSYVSVQSVQDGTAVHWQDAV
jgi:quercetin dioxygenase-like cupin family protein